jgi:UDPglucose--hexose-1-phosphate uridylyltransferase
MRHDWLTDRWVIMAPQRTARPLDFVPQPTQILSNANCPFCLGHEKQTPTEVASYTKHAAHDVLGNWHVRVVPNKFPAVTQSAPATLVAAGSMAAVGFEQNIDERKTISELPQSPWNEAESLTGGEVSENSLKLFQRRDISGGHEVIIEGPNHLQSLSQLDRETVSLVFRAYRDRLQYWMNEQSIAYAVVFKNVGQEAGASLVHSHSQLISTNIVPTDVVRAAKRMNQFFEQEGACLYCQTVQDELQQQVRIVDQTKNFVAFCPFASRLPALVTITSKFHLDQFESQSDDQLEELAWLVHQNVRRLEYCFPEVAYNYVIHTAPLENQGSPAYHWRLELFPRISTKAGFEWGSECFINPLLPEASAQQLRSARI